MRQDYLRRNRENVLSSKFAGRAKFDNGQVRKSVLAKASICQVRQRSGTASGRRRLRPIQISHSIVSAADNQR